MHPSESGDSQLTGAKDDLRQRDDGGEVAVLFCRHCDSEPIGPLAASASPG